MENNGRYGYGIHPRYFIYFAEFVVISLLLCLCRLDGGEVVFYFIGFFLCCYCKYARD